MSYDEHELYVVCNILVGDTTIDPVFGHSYDDYFQVNWGGTPFRLAPGDTAVVEQYLAEHFANHLIDYILTRDKKMIHDSSLREPLRAKIILKKADETDRPYIPSTDRALRAPETAPEPSGGNFEPHGTGENTDPLSREETTRSANPGETTEGSTGGSQAHGGIKPSKTTPGRKAS